MKSMLKKLSVLLGVLMVALVLTGCTPKKADPTPTPTAVATDAPTVEPVVESTVETVVDATATPAS